MERKTSKKPSSALDLHHYAILCPGIERLCRFQIEDDAAIGGRSP
jgi:hypothetical protein